jgi:hypothetical protein
MREHTPTTDNTNGKPVAILICHGMGQQVPFETLDCVAKAIARAERRRHRRAPQVSVRLARLGDQHLPRAEMQITTPGGQLRSVHLYEAYWAPLTEGKVTAADVTSFLLDAWRRGMRYARAGVMTRHIFGRKRTFPLPPWTTTQLVAAFAVLCTGWSVFFATWLVMPFLLAACARQDGLGWRLVMVIDGWGMLAAITWQMRQLYFQYVGDVAAYVSSHKVNRFAEVRFAVRKVALDLARAVYGARAPDAGDEYGEVYVVGHSLGSVVAYDTLNSMLNEDLLAPPDKRLRVRDRTRLLLTLGSPLDKTAFIFRTQLKDAPVREALAEAMQPLIQSYDHRPDYWVNIHTWKDPISGPLNLYDIPNPTPRDLRHRARFIRNTVDPDARRLGRAHVDYWAHPLLGNVLHDVLGGMEPVPDAVPRFRGEERLAEAETAEF